MVNRGESCRLRATRFTTAVNKFPSPLPPDRTTNTLKPASPFTKGQTFECNQSESFCRQKLSVDVAKMIISSLTLYCIDTDFYVSTTDRF